ncbi:hypothetical protein KO504_16325 [Winogradskyella psychrotolerans]|uniref:DUF6090 family protein n=1 Tax=Winogradskyella psychrotolerans TaxID=1344585 RepID=UPI001C07B43D|nr:DUF6090 family protein [Winogradskyella psychrotolerans]MBU2922917.1 hypothetical protein [Winogradskyella psychrotolerans]
MIKFFRKLRQNMIREHRASKYLLYAIGEIILVVIGILIALQINNWNQELANKKEEQTIIKNLNLEFKKNIISVQEYIKHHKTILSDTRVLIDLVGEPEEVLNKFNLDSLLAQSINYWSYKPSQSVVLDVISSGKLNLISSDSLRLQFFEWSSNLEKNEENYNTLDEINQSIVLTYLTKHASLKNIDNYGILEWNKKSKLKHSNYKMFQDIEFENVMDNQAWDIKNYILSLENLEHTMARIIAETNRDL